MVEPIECRVTARTGDGTLRAALQIYLETKNLLVIGGVSELDGSIRNLATSVTTQFEQALDVGYLDGLPLPELVERVADVDPHTVVVMLTYHAGVSSNNYVTREMVEMTSSARDETI